jgi:hypothetical protein
MKTITPIRLALRVEGNWWVAYLAETATMAGAHEIGRIAFGAARDPAIKRGFMDLMQLVMMQGLESLGIKVESVDVRDAPESERSGRA